MGRVQILEGVYILTGQSHMGEWHSETYSHVEVERETRQGRLVWKLLQ